MAKSSPEKSFSSKRLRTKGVSSSALRLSGIVSSTKIVNEIVDRIEIGILFGEFKPREHLVQNLLAKKYAVGRNIIRAVLKNLEEKSVIENFPNRGSRVKEISAKNAKDLYSLRFLLESRAAELAVTRMTPPKILKLESLSDEMEKNLQKGNFKGFTLTHEKFHQLIFEAAENSYLLKMIRELRSASASIRNFSYSRYSLPETKNHLFDEHRQMILCLKNGDGRKIGQLSHFHIQAGINYYLRYFFPKESPLD